MATLTTAPTWPADEPRVPFPSEPVIPAPEPLRTATLWAEDGQGADYRAYAVTVEYQWFTGKAQVPLAMADPAPGQPACQVVKLHAPYGVKVVRYFAVRDGKQPVLPSPEPSPGSPDAANTVLLSATVTPATPELLPGGTSFRYQVVGEYKYALLTPKTPSTGFPSCAAPYNTAPAPLHLLPPEQFDPNLLG